ncbi:MAG: hypothetical protein QOH61_2613 [Chloroflexota bacterium]|jgi:hypothetical protein|nr:hypothetical protein [Chloroflexota bacterium]
MDLNLPTIDTSKIRARLGNADPRRVDTSRFRPSIDLPSISMPQIDLPSIDLPHVERPQIPSLDDAGRAVGDAGRAVSSAAGDAGRLVTGAASEAGRAIGGALETAGDRLRDIRTAVAPAPKRTSGLARGLTAGVVVAIGAAVAAGVAFFLDPARGARRRAALRRRISARSGMARTGVETARRAGERAVELVRIPVESARDLVGAGSRNGHSLENGMDFGAASAMGGESSMPGMGSLADRVSEDESISGNAESRADGLDYLGGQAAGEDLFQPEGERSEESERTRAEAVGE